jgi:uncharacterized membrane protein
MSGAEIGLALSVFLASAVECVEALTIVLAVGSTRDWRSALAGVGAALFLLAAAVAALGTGLSEVPLSPLRVAVGAFLLVFGLKWLRKAVLRASHRKAAHDEALIFQEQADAASGAARPGSGWDPYSFTVALKGVLIEGLEVVLIVLGLGAQRHHVDLAAAAAGAAALLVAGVGVAVRRPLARVPENAMKFAVGVMLVSFGVFWAAEGIGLHWPGGDAILPAIVASVLACAGGSVALLRRAGPGVSLP